MPYRIGASCLPCLHVSSSRGMEDCRISGYCFGKTILTESFATPFCRRTSLAVSVRTAPDGRHHHVYHFGERSRSDSPVIAPAPILARQERPPDPDLSVNAVVAVKPRRANDLLRTGFEDHERSSGGQDLLEEGINGSRASPTDSFTGASLPAR